MNPFATAPPTLTEEYVGTKTKAPTPTADVEHRVVDWSLLLNVVALMGFGLLMILSASSLSADALYGNPFHFVTRQGMGIAMGLVVWMGLWLTPMKWIRASVYPFFGVVLFLQVLVLSPAGHAAKGAQRWIAIGPINLQPSELAKLALIAALAHFFSVNRGRLHDVLGVALPALCFPIPYIILIVFQKDFGTTVILLGLTAVLYFVAGLQHRYSMLLGMMAAAGLALMALLEPYRIMRLTNFSDPFRDESGAGYQVIQGWIALATGGFWGTGLGSGVAQRGFVPEAHTDFISAVVGEELGVWGFLLMVGLLGGLVLQGMRVAMRAPDMFGMLAAAGISAMFGAQIFINIGVVGGVVPPKGLVLPFMSYGASAVLVHTIAAGVLLKISSVSPKQGDSWLASWWPDTNEVLATQ